MIGWILQCLKSRKTMTSTEEQTCRRCRNAQRTSQARISQSRRWSQVFQRFMKGAQSYRFSRSRRGNAEMVKWISKFSLLLKRLRDAWMDMLPVSVMSQEQRENQYLVDVARENIERQRRNEDALDPNDQANRDHWLATQVANHERSFPFSDNLTTLMFLVACDLSEAHRETF